MPAVSRDLMDFVDLMEQEDCLEILDHQDLKVDCCSYEIMIIIIVIILIK